MAIKFGRSYELTVGTKTGQVTVRLPFTLEFDILRNALSSANTCQVRLFNLNQETRNRLRFNITNYGIRYPIQLKAGYGTNSVYWPVIFQGNISAAWSFREGVNMITQIECYDGGFAYANGETSQQFPTGALNKTVIATVASTLPGVTVGAIGDFPGQLTRPASYSGPTMDILTDLTGGAAYIDQGKFNALRDSEYILGVPILVNASTGLLGTPMLEQTIVRFEMLFTPELYVGGRIRLTSSTDGNFDGDYKTISVQHRGMISESVCGEVVTTGEFFYSKELVGVPSL